MTDCGDRPRWGGHVPAGQGLVAALMSIMDRPEAELFLQDYLRNAAPLPADEERRFRMRVRAMADWLRDHDTGRRDATLQ